MSARSLESCSHLPVMPYWSVSEDLVSNPYPNWPPILWTSLLWILPFPLLTPWLILRLIFNCITTKLPLRTKDSCGFSLKVKLLTNVSWFTLTICWPLVKSPICTLVMKRIKLSITWDPKLKTTVFPIQEKTVGNGSLTRPKRISICLSVSPPLVNLSDKELENSPLWSITLSLTGSKTGLMMLWWVSPVLSWQIST